MGALLSDLESARDHRLLELHRAGDPHAFEQLYREYYARLLRFCRSRVRDPYTAEELAQETFTRAIEAAKRLNDGSRFYPWLTVIAHRLAIDHYRRGSRVHPSPDLDPGEHPSADEHLMREVEAEALDLALSRLRERHRQVLRWREGENLSYEAIAERLGSPITTVPPLLHRAREALRREYAAVTSGDWAVLPTVPGMVMAARRLRDRLLQGLSRLPEPSGLAAPVASLLITVTALLVPGSDAVRLADVERGAALGPLGDGEEQFLDGRVGEGPSVGEPGSVVDMPPPPNHVVGIAEINVNNHERRRWGREQAREMPIYYEFGDVAFGADPGAMQRDIESTLAGDLSWTEGKCGRSEHGC